MWTALVASQFVLVGLAVVAVRLLRFVRGATGNSTGASVKVTRSHVERRMGRSAVDRHTADLYGKDAIVGREPLALGVDVATGTRLFAKSEDYILAVGVPRVGKGEGFVIPAVLRHKGPAVVTATRHDTYMDTARVRAIHGPVYVFDPQGLVPDAEKLRWNPVKGCEVPQKAILRARGFAGFAGVGPAVDGGGAYWEQVAASIIRSYLHAAALEGLGVEQLLDWSRRPGAREPVRILSRHAHAARGWDEDLAASAEVEPRHRDSIWATVRRAFDCFADPMVLEATRVDHDTFDPASFLVQHGTIYLMGSPGAQHSVAPIVAALIEDVVDVARHEAAASSTRRLESGLVLMLDECANIAPLGDLPKLVAELGGLGITTAVILQSVASARTIWGEAGERALRDLANITLVWGGQKDVVFLEEISRLGRRARRAGRDLHPQRRRAVQLMDATSDAGACPSETSPTWRLITPSWCLLTFDLVSRTCRPGAMTGILKALVGAEPKQRSTELRPVDDAELIRSERRSPCRPSRRGWRPCVRRLEQQVDEHSAVPTTSRRSQIACSPFRRPSYRQEKESTSNTWPRGSTGCRNATRLPVTGYGRAGGATASSSRNSPLSAHHGWVCTQPTSPLRRQPRSSGTKRLRNAGNASAERSVRGPGCTAVNHKPDQSVTDDPRWAEEQMALCGAQETRS